ncbi:MAG: efflux transporter outer membrane subunit [Gammaproteobacteria bacterium]|nr:efflux transporter outer membrane subunit [Gammaproteobacteria bacterium]
MRLNMMRVFVIISFWQSLSGCVMLNEISQKFNPKTTIDNVTPPTRWQATLPHEGSQANLTQFWQQFQDPLLLSLIDAAEKESATLATAKARIAQARAKLAEANAALMPAVDGSASASRSVQQPSTTIQGSGAQGGSNSGSGAFNSAQIAAQASWELDIFGANHAVLESSKAQESAAKAGWHEARVSVAAELANTYFNQRFCELQVGVLQADAMSRAQSVRLTDIAVNAGFSAPASSHLAKASLADATQQLKAQQAQCDLEVKALVALTDLDEGVLREKLANQPFKADINAVDGIFKLNEIPAQILAQRPDIYTAEADLVTAAADVKDTYVQGLPKVSLNGSIGWMWLSGTGFSTNGKTWSLGPISITFPIYHGDVQETGMASAEANYEDKAANYRSKVRYAVKEVEDALVNLHSANTRQADIAEAAKGYRASFVATETKVKAGFANLIELEEQRRTVLVTETTALNNLKQRTQAWISLYRAAGGGWQHEEAPSIGSDK